MALINTIKMSNGWTLDEYTTENEAVFVGDNYLRTGEKGRFTVRFIRVPSKQLVKIIYLRGTTPGDNPWAVGVAAGIARGKNRRLPWTRYRMPNGRNWYYGVTLGSPVNEVEEFEKLRRGALTDDTVDLEFQSIVQQMEGLTA